MKMWQCLLFSFFVICERGFAFKKVGILQTRLKSTMNTHPLALIVNVEIREDRIDDFLKVIEEDAIGSRERENGGYLRFDVARDQTNPNKFVFYEVYVDNDAAARHKETPHFKLWSDFKASGGVLSQSVIKADAIFFG